MEELLAAYEEKQKSIRLKNATRKKEIFGFGISGTSDPMKSLSRQIPMYDVIQLGSNQIRLGLGHRSPRSASPWRRGCAEAR